MQKQPSATLGHDIVVPVVVVEGVVVGIEVEVVGVEAEVDEDMIILHAMIAIVTFSNILT